MRCRVKNIDDTQYVNISELRAVFLEMILALGNKHKKISLRVGLAVTIYILDSIQRTALEEDLEEIKFTRSMMKKYVNKAIKKNKKSIDKILELELDEDVEEITQHELNVVSEGIKISLSENIEELQEALKVLQSDHVDILKKLEVLLKDEKEEKTKKTEAVTIENDNKKNQKK